MDCTCGAQSQARKRTPPKATQSCPKGPIGKKGLGRKGQDWKGQVGKKGVVRDPVLHNEVCRRISDWFTKLEGWQVIGVEKSPITGPEGNIEFLIAASHC